HRLPLLERLSRRRDEDQLVELQLLVGIAPRQQMPDVGGIEAAAEDAESHRISAAGPAAASGGGPPVRSPARPCTRSRLPGRLETTRATGHTSRKRPPST